MMHCVIETHAFKSGAKDAELDEEEVFKIMQYLSENPDAGELIVGTGGARKIRFPDRRRGKGKSGGYRVVTYYAAEDIPVFLLDVFSKGDKINLSKAEREALRKELEGLADDYRESVRLKVTSLKEKAS